jgi:uncharacterized protein (DUF849 family)
MSALGKLHPIINLAGTGMIPTKEMTPHVPISPQEIIETSLRCAEMGVQITHIHPRDEMGRPTWKKEAFQKIICGIRSKNPNILISATTSGRNWSDFERRSECLDLDGDDKPDLGSLTVGSLNFIRSASVNAPEIIHQLAQKMMDRGIKPELEIFEAGMLYKANVMLNTGIIKDERPYFNILLGSLGTSPLHPAIFGGIHALLPSNAEWAVAGVGNFQLDANTMSLAYGGNIRVGLEDNIYLDRHKKILATNEQLVERVLKIMGLMGLRPASFQETCQRLGLRG